VWGRCQKSIIKNRFIMHYELFTFKYMWLKFSSSLYSENKDLIHKVHVSKHIKHLHAKQSDSAGLFPKNMLLILGINN
jgi:hypothetical protein